MPGGWEWVIIAVVAVLIFGGTRLAGVGKSAGKAIHDFKEELNKDDAKADTPDKEADAAPEADEAQPES
ncbi:MAG: twin-arginine translocase TatA/TatE family subunit [Propionibacteriaceae bacterium]|jgi:sec-independent protein translocase protein TatA|nr:twin-arginine translocase TatA/TatE family subunit [Propionibacteriaceae bacterium]